MNSVHLKAILMLLGLRGGGSKRLKLDTIKKHAISSFHLKGASNDAIRKRKEIVKSTFI